MNLLDIIFLAIALAMDCFAVSIVSGVLTRKEWIPRMAFLFGFFQALMPLIGWIGISFFRQGIEDYDHWLAFGLLLLIGGKPQVSMLWLLVSHLSVQDMMKSPSSCFLLL